MLLLSCPLHRPPYDFVLVRGSLWYGGHLLVATFASNVPFPAYKQLLRSLFLFRLINQPLGVVAPLGQLSGVQDLLCNFHFVDECPVVMPDMCPRFRIVRCFIQDGRFSLVGKLVNYFHGSLLSNQYRSVLALADF